MATYGEALHSVKSGFLIIGLTGYTGSGCTTARKILMKSQVCFPGIETLRNKPDERVYRKLQRVWRRFEPQWSRFIDVEASRVIFMLMIHRALRYEYKTGHLAQLREVVLPYEKKLEGVSYLTEGNIDVKKADVARKLVNAYRTARRLYMPFKNKCGYDLATFIEIMQDSGDNIRKFGQPIKGRKLESKNIFVLPEALRRLIRAYRVLDRTSNFVIDAFRNPFEVEYFKRRYSEFYLVAIQRSAPERRVALQGLNGEANKRLESREKGRKIEEKRKDNIHEWVTSQNLDECFQKADYFIDNVCDTSRTWPKLRYDLMKLMCLVKNPGCIPPDKDEHNMQIAMSIKHNSGCLSRHVGAVVVDPKGYVLGIGWNDPPTGEIACALRTGNELVDKLCPDPVAFSLLERKDVFTKHIGNRYTDKPYCFKDEYGCISDKGKRTELCRALHAEQNAIRQVNEKNLEGTTLYTTDSPCENCAKIISQSSISRIVYIEEYPGIARQQMQSGKKKIKWEQFKGVTGSGYYRLFNSLMPEKDMLNLYS